MSTARRITLGDGFTLLDALSSRMAGDRASDPLYVSRGRELLEPDRFPAATRTATAATSEGAFRA